MAAIGSLTVVCFYLIVQMVGAGQLIKLLFGLDYHIAVIVVGALMVVYVTFGGMVATTWVQIIKACLLLFGGSVITVLAFSQFGFSFNTLAAKTIENPQNERHVVCARKAAGRPDQRHFTGIGFDVRAGGSAAYFDAFLYRQ